MELIVTDEEAAAVRRLIGCECEEVKEREVKEEVTEVSGEEKEEEVKEEEAAALQEEEDEMFQVEKPSKKPAKKPVVVEDEDFDDE